MSDKAKCGLSGCEIPSSITHTHLTYDAATDSLSDRLFRGSEPYVIPADAPMVPGRKLRDTLMMAGKPRRAADFHGVNIVEDLPRSSLGMPGWDHPKSLTGVQIIGRIATGIVLAIGVASILILSAMTAGWL